MSLSQFFVSPVVYLAFTFFKSIKNANENCVNILVFSVVFVVNIEISHKNGKLVFILTKTTKILSCIILQETFREVFFKGEMTLMSYFCLLDFVLD